MLDVLEYVRIYIMCRSCFRLFMIMRPIKRNKYLSSRKDSYRGKSRNLPHNIRSLKFLCFCLYLSVTFLQPGAIKTGKTTDPCYTLFPRVSNYGSETLHQNSSRNLFEERSELEGPWIFLYIKVISLILYNMHCTMYIYC